MNLDRTDRRILELAAQGYTAKQIAHDLDLNMGNTYWLIRKLKELMLCDTLAQAVHIATARGYIDEQACRLPREDTSAGTTRGS